MSNQNLKVFINTPFAKLPSSNPIPMLQNITHLGPVDFEHLSLPLWLCVFIDGAGPHTHNILESGCKDVTWMYQTYASWISLAMIIIYFSGSFLALLLMIGILYGCASNLNCLRNKRYGFRLNVTGVGQKLNIQKDVMITGGTSDEEKGEISSVWLREDNEDDEDEMMENSYQTFPWFNLILNDRHDYGNVTLNLHNYLKDIRIRQTSRTLKCTEKYIETLHDGAAKPVPCITGGNSDEYGVPDTFKTTAADHKDNVAGNYGDYADEFLSLYPAGNDTQASLSETAIIAYALENLWAQSGVNYTAEDYYVGNVLSNYWANFVKTTDPNSGDSYNNGTLPATWESNSSTKRETFKVGAENSMIAVAASLAKIEAFLKWFADTPAI
ncbi:hypothetical protein BOTNAR_0560g00070 [Botryotinia narcissicola]|uniref:Uncharacterized protein n=1 Tax=Botryotinia narcissicola TaxID=278944 RepID=A0A4Z1HJF3_9HELO|nr:hypothetical protein BOTNAR_0560g00070 [Botryotinia narcissicola]